MPTYASLLLGIPTYIVDKHQKLVLILIIQEGWRYSMLPLLLICVVRLIYALAWWQ